ncbi:MAG: polysaccharide biosynthesis tyrosine autokinase [Anaerolineaceae bacterium]|nr:polysaccharide biosynthesis tyrosine autokinase [Anaerolineaceae bacterium]MDD4042245.1 polysaccharide biosynthesis tyrosine autokinase [Anaerolineaceae bacterium]MDD4578558.1 polysaccharide biosynthesis tyrosine autokinase [Anaerolineaceae bacterium]
MDIKQVFTTIKRWLWLLILGLVIGGGIGYYISIRQTPIYQAQARFVILPAAQTSYDYYSYLNNQDLIDTYAQLLTTEELLFQASETLGFPVRKGQATAQQVDDTKFVVLTVKDPDPFKAATIANGLVEIMISQNEKLQSVQFEAAENNLQTRITQAEEQISILESQITTMSSELLQTQIESVQLQMDDVQIQVNNLKTDMALIYPEILTAEGMSRIDLESLSQEDIAQLTAYQTKLDEIMPILELYQKIYTELVVLGQSSGTASRDSNALERLKTTLNLYQQIYIASINNLETLKLAKAQNTPTVMQVETAVKPTVPISPKPTQTAMLGAAIGLIATAALVFLIEFLDDTLKTPDEIKAVLNSPVIGFIGELKHNSKKSEDSLGVYVAKNPRSPVSEAFRALRTNLEYSSVDNPLQTILITSSGEAEGKSTIATNLAIVEAQSGKKTVVVDADMRRPKVHTHFNKPNRMGLSDVVTGKLSIDDVLKAYEQVENLYIITCGTIPPNPAELLGSDRMSQILKELEKRFDIIIIDIAPMIVSDAQILSTKVDGVVYVIIPGQTRAVTAMRPLEALERIGAKVVGVVANKIPKNRDYYYGGYNYYSPYSNHYSYHSESVVPNSDVQPEPKKATALGSVFDKYQRKDAEK